MYEYKATVIKVVDGDTLHLNIDLGFNINYNKQIIRLARINAPELLCNKQVTIKTIKDTKDKYGRYLAEVYLEDLNINEYAVSYLK